MSVALVSTAPVVVISSDDRVTRFAAAEWLRYRLAGPGDALAAVAVDPAIVRSCPPLRPGEAWTYQADPPTIHAASPVALLQAVYRRLEFDGWRWYFPGPLGEVYRPGLPPPAEASSGAFVERVLIDRSRPAEDPDTWRTELRLLIEWMARQGFTTLALEGAPEPQDIAPLHSELARRGLRLEIGGDLVGRLLAAARPAAPAGDAGRLGPPRPARLEAADAEALAGLPRAAHAFVSGYGAVAALRLTEPADAPLQLPEGPDSPTPGQRLTAVVEGVLRGLAERAGVVVWRPQAASRRDFTAPPEAMLVEPLAERSLCAPLGATDLPEHRKVIERLAPLLERPGGIEVATRYADSTWLQNLTAPLVHLIAADLRALARVGVRRVATVTHGAMSWWLCPLNLYTFACCARDPSADADAFLADWCDGLYGPAGEVMRDYTCWFERLMQPVWRAHDLSDGRDRSAEARRLLAPLSDACAALERLPARIDQAVAEVRDRPTAARLERERTVCRLNAIHAMLRLVRLQAYAGHPTLALRAAERDLVAQAVEHVHHLPSAAGGAELRREYLGTLARLTGHRVTDAAWQTA